MKLIILIGVIGLSGMPSVTRATPPTYSITDLGLGTSVEGIGNNDQVLAAGPSGDLFVFHPNGTMTDLTILIDDSEICFGPEYTRAVSGLSNNNGTELVLNSSYQRYDCAVTYQDGVLTAVTGYLEGSATGINDSGTIIGNNQPGIGTGGDCKYYLPSGDNLLAVLINDSGQIVGWDITPGSFYLCTQGVWQLLPPLSGSSTSYPAAINKEGTVVGTATINGQSHGFRTSPKGITTDLGTDIQVNDVNALNQNVGYFTTGTNHSFMREGGVTYDLNTLISSTDPLQPYVTFADPTVRINDNGVIAVIGTDSRTGINHVYLLKPM